MIDNAWALGQWEEDNGVFRIWKRTVESHRIRAQRRLDIDSVIPLLSPTSLVLLSYGVDLPDDTVTDLQATQSKLLVYIPAGSREVAPDEAVKLCSEGVLGFFAERGGLPDSLEYRLASFFFRKPMFTKIELRLRKRSGPPCAFLASPYAPPMHTEFMNAATAALQARGIQVNDPRDVHRGGTVGQKVDALIKESDFLVANLSLTKGGFNPNVWMEIGYARGLGKQVVPFRYAGDAEPVASDLKGIDYLKYHNGLDLAMKLYWGLDWIGHP